MKAVVLGGTGTLGRALTKELLKTYARVVCVSRDELKQKEMARDFPSEKALSFRIGDVRDRESLVSLMIGANVVFHVAAMKHIDVAEENPEECVKTNVQGTINVADAAECAGVPHCAFSSTDKAVEPVNVYGMTKALSERILLRRNDTQFVTRFSVFRWGNVVGSRGSVIPQFAKTLKAEGRAYLTHPEMTRFWIPIDAAVAFMLDNFRSAHRAQAMIPPIRSARVIDVIEATARIVGVEKPELVMTGTRPGERLHELMAPGKSSGVGAHLEGAELEHLLRPILEAPL